MFFSFSHKYNIIIIIRKSTLIQCNHPLTDPILNFTTCPNSASWSPPFLSPSRSCIVLGCHVYLSFKQVSQTLMHFNQSSSIISSWPYLALSQGIGLLSITKKCRELCSKLGCCDLSSILHYNRKRKHHAIINFHLNFMSNNLLVSDSEIPTWNIDSTYHIHTDFPSQTKQNKQNINKKPLQSYA
jgi:hypothetical protein